MRAMWIIVGALLVVALALGAGVVAVLWQSVDDLSRTGGLVGPDAAAPAARDQEAR
jgi:hypothetical protein